jgi:hypothetical protein
LHPSGADGSSSTPHTLKINQAACVSARVVAAKTGYWAITKLEGQFLELLRPLDLQALLMGADLTLSLNSILWNW